MKDNPAEGTGAFGATVPARESGRPPPQVRGAAIGRYVVLDVLGTGGMGIVYAAYDPELDRRVAIKLLQAQAPSQRTSDGRARLLREAQAIARIAHPNVVAVHDVGTFGDEIFVAMEYVDGETLTAWLAREVRSQDAILAMFLQAGRGLAAAHAKSVVHRDFKPDNALVGADGRARVVDFGIAHAIDAGRALSLSDTRPIVREDTSRPSLSIGLDAALTRTGEVMGTPLYMAPEQFLGGPADARSDQYSFSVALLEALQGEHPIEPAIDVAAFAGHVTRGELRPDPADRKLPARLRRTIARGMAVDKAARFESMDALLAALAPPGRTSAGRWGLALAIVALGAGTGMWVAHRAAGAATACAGGPRELAGAWDASRKTAVETAFARSAEPFANDARVAATAALDAYATRWSAMHDEACVATRVKGEQSVELLDLRMACLAERRDELRALVDTFATADDGVVERATQAAQSLPDVDACADVTALRTPTPPPRDPALRARIDGARELLARARALEAAGKYGDLLGLTEVAARDAASIGYRPLQADALLALGRARYLHGDRKGARDTLFDAVVAAEEGRHDRAAAEALIELTSVRGQLDAFAEAHDSDRLAAAVIDRLGGDDALTARRTYVLGKLMHEEGRYEDALTQFRSSLDRMRALGDDHVEVAALLDSTGLALRELGRYDEAIASYRQALAIVERELGPEHPRVAKTLQNLSLVYSDKGDSAAALEQSSRALAIKQRVFGADSPEVASALIDLGNGLDGLGRFDEATAAYLRALDVLEKTRGPESAGSADVLFDLNQTYLEQGRPQDALPYAERALAIREKLYGPSHPEVGAALIGVGEALCGAGRCAQAVPIEERALAVTEAAFGPSHVQTAEALRGLGEARLGAHDAAHAVPVLERAYALYQKVDGAPSERAQCAFALARALWDSGGDRERALRLAEESRAENAAGGPQSAKALADVERWRAHRRI